MRSKAKSSQINWQNVLLSASSIVQSYETGVTLRQLFYRLVSQQMIPNSVSAYKVLSRKTAEARREGTFPALIDRTRAIEVSQSFDDPDDALTWLWKIYRRDRTQNQQWSIYLGVEKHGMVVQLEDWFGKYGIPILALGGYSSQTFVDVVTDDVINQHRSSVLLYAGDFDPSGVDIDRDFLDRTNIFDEVRRVALRSDQLEEYNLPPLPGKEWDARATSFIAQYGELMQVELDALPPEEMRKLYQTALDEFFDYDAYNSIIDEEEKELRQLDKISAEFGLSTPDLLRGRMKGANKQTLASMARVIKDIQKERER